MPKESVHIIYDGKYWHVFTGQKIQRFSFTNEKHVTRFLKELRQRVKAQPA